MNNGVAHAATVEDDVGKMWIGVRRRLAARLRRVACWVAPSERQGGRVIHSMTSASGSRQAFAVGTTSGEVLGATLASAALWIIGDDGPASVQAVLHGHYYFDMSFKIELTPVSAEKAKAPLNGAWFATVIRGVDPGDTH